MRRMPQFLLIFTMITSSWLLMQAVHEAGHVLAGWMTGGTVARVTLHPFTISRTDMKHNPSPLWVCWGGPAVGAVVPALIWLVARRLGLRCVSSLRFFAGFCLIANGAYLAVGVNEGIGDAGDLLRYGSSAWMLYLFGMATIPTGLWLWNGLGPRYGLGSKTEPVTWRAALVSTLVLLATVTAEVVADWLTK